MQTLLYRSRIVAGCVTAALLAVGLTGCATAVGSGTDCTSSVQAGTESESVTARSALFHAPTVTFPTPTHVSTSEQSTLITGTGPSIQATQEIVADLTIANATTGKVVAASEYTGTAGAATFVVGTVPLKGIARALTCAKVGSRVAMVLSPKDGYPKANRPADLKATDSIVVVADIRTAYLARANGTNQVMAAGLPAVVLAPNGRPGITIPATPAPTKLTVANLKDGSGVKLKKGDTAVVQYTGVLWDGKTVFDSSWPSGQPAALPLKTGSAGIVKGLVTALTGQRVGSQVLAVLPPDQAYGKAGSGTAIPANATLVFVVDILGKQ